MIRVDKKYLKLAAAIGAILCVICSAVLAGFGVKAYSDFLLMALLLFVFAFFY